MRDFPVFNTEYGVASLVLKEIPYQGTAYVTLQSTMQPEELLAECVEFCRVCGADRIFAAGHDILQKYPLYTMMWRMRCGGDTLPETDAALFPVQAQTLEQWREIYNEKVRRIPNGAWMTQKDADAMLKDGSGYFVHRHGELLGIGKVDGNEIQWLASVRHGAGADLVSALAHAACGSDLELTVASENKKAVALYERLGFVKAQEISRWYNVYKSGEIYL